VDASPTSLHAFLSSLEDTCSYGETASPHVLIDVLIYITGMLRGQYKAPAGLSYHLPGLRVVFACALEQTEFLSPANGCAAVVYPELRVNVIGVSTQSVQGHHELTGNVRATQVGPEQPEHFKLTYAQWLD